MADIPVDDRHDDRMVDIPVDDRPDDREDANKRPGCPEVEKPLTALVPPLYYPALTIFEYPTFWYYVPYFATDLQSSKLVLWNEQQRKVYETNFTVINTPGIINLRFPENAPPLEVNKIYEVDFSLACKLGGLSRVKTHIKRVSLNLNIRDKLEAATTPQERYAIYAAHSLWQDLLTELAKLRCANPEDKKIVADWESLLRNPRIRLDKISSEPLVLCCNSEQ